MPMSAPTPPAPQPLLQPPFQTLVISTGDRGERMAYILCCIGLTVVAAWAGAAWLVLISLGYLVYAAGRFSDPVVPALTLSVEKLTLHQQRVDVAWQDLAGVSVDIQVSGSSLSAAWLDLTLTGDKPRQLRLDVKDLNLAPQLIVRRISEMQAYHRGMQARAQAMAAGPGDLSWLAAQTGEAFQLPAPDVPGFRLRRDRRGLGVLCALLALAAVFGALRWSPWCWAAVPLMAWCSHRLLTDQRDVLVFTAAGLHDSRTRTHVPWPAIVHFKRDISAQQGSTSGDHMALTVMRVGGAEEVIVNLLGLSEPPDEVSRRMLAWHAAETRR